MPRSHELDFHCAGMWNGPGSYKYLPDMSVVSQSNGNLYYTKTQYPRTGRFLTLFKMTSFLSEADTLLES